MRGYEDCKCKEKAMLTWDVENCPIHGNKANAAVQPNHYNFSEHECKDIMIELFGPQCCLSMAFKYLWRAGHKGPMRDDIHKAKTWLGFYLDATK